MKKVFQVAAFCMVAIVVLASAKTLGNDEGYVSIVEITNPVGDKSVYTNCLFMNQSLTTGTTQVRWILKDKRTNSIVLPSNVLPLNINTYITTQNTINFECEALYFEISINNNKERPNSALI